MQSKRSYRFQLGYCEGVVVSGKTGPKGKGIEQSAFQRETEKDF